jgi:hypothetical protein
LPPITAWTGARMSAGVLVPSLGVAISLGAIVYAYWLFARVMFPVSDNKSREAGRRSESLHDCDRKEIEGSETEPPSHLRGRPTLVYDRDALG